MGERESTTTLPPEIAAAIDAFDGAVSGFCFNRIPPERLAAARARLEALIAGLVEWQPIETAPKDGTRIWLWIEPTKIDMPFSWEADRWMGDDFPLNMAWATHWRPSPPPPTTQAKDGSER